MRQLFSCFLFQTRPGDGLSPRRRAAFWLWNALLVTGAAVGLGLASLLLATGQYSARVLLLDYICHPVLLLLNLLPPLLLVGLLYAATGRAWLACLLASLPVLGLSLGNYYKLAFRDDPVIASDLLILGEAGKMAGQYKLFFSNKAALALLCAGGSIVVLALFARGRPRGRVRAGLAAAAAVCAAALIPVYASDSVYSKNTNTAHINQWSTTQQYVSRGLLYPFLHSVKDALPDPPEGYDQKEAEALLAQYQDKDIPEDKKVNVVAVMLEAFTDFSAFEGIEFAKDVYAQYHALEAESYTGNLLTNIFAGGTVDTERAFLTGMGPKNIDYRANTSSYVWYLKDQGYQTFGGHPCNNWFYNRQNINRYLGFDEYRFAEDYYGPMYGASPTLNDYLFLTDLANTVAERLKADAPLFSFSVTYQGHGPYASDASWWNEVDSYIGNKDLPEDQRTILANYLGSVENTQMHLVDLVDSLRRSEEPVVLLLFGDHKPWLGNGNSVYDALDVDLSRTDAASFYNYWSTRYLIWANDAAKEAVGHDMVGTGPDVSPCFLMNVLFEQLGWEGDAYMQAADACRREVPVVHSYGIYFTADGAMKTDDALTDEQRELVRQFRCLEYYRQHHFSGG